MFHNTAEILKVLYFGQPPHPPRRIWLPKCFKDNWCAMSERP